MWVEEWRWNTHTRCVGIEVEPNTIDCQQQNNSCTKACSAESQFDVLLIVRSKVILWHCPQSIILEESGEWNYRHRTLNLPASHCTARPIFIGVLRHLASVLYSVCVCECVRMFLCARARVYVCVCVPLE